MILPPDNELSTALETLKIMKVPHKRYNDTLMQVKGSAFASLPGEIICVTGPSRVGKTTATYNAFADMFMNNEALCISDIPIVRVRLRNSTKKGHYDSKLFIRSALAAIDHPIYGYPEPDDKFGLAFDKRMGNTSEDILTSAFARAIKARNTKYLLIDEVQHLHYACGGAHGALAIFDSWKAFAEDEEIVLVLIGTYLITTLLDLSAHMLGRMSIVEFPRYKETSEDIEEFQRILNTLDVIIPISSGKISDYNEYLYRGTMGCIGLLFRWIRGTIGYAIANGKSKIDKQLLAAHRHRDTALASISEEIRQGEATLQRTDFASSKSSKNPPKPGKNSKGNLKPFQSKQRNYPQGARSDG